MSKARGSLKDSKLGKQEALQAVVLADDFGTSLSPTQEVFPSVLTPVANTHLLDYLIETLIQSGVNEVFIYCSSHIDLLKNYIGSKSFTDISVSLILSDGCRSLADALRDIDAKGWIRGDFILIRGDTFINANLTRLMEQHRANKEHDKGLAMTLVLRNLGSTKNSILDTEACLFAADRSKNQILFYRPPGSLEKKIKFELEWFLDHEQVEINSSFIDTHVYMCSPSVLPLFADNFDFQTMDDFIRGVLMSEEILDARIYWVPLKPNEYSLPLTSWSAYHTLNRDILQRQGYPLTPDMLSPLNGMLYSSRSTYKHRSATLARGCTLQKNTLVGKQSVLGKNTLVSRSVVGDNCTIGENVVIESSYVLGNVKIHSNSVVKNSVLFPNCIVGEASHLDICIVAQGVQLPAGSRHTDSIVEKGDEGAVVCRTMSEYCEDLEGFTYFKRVVEAPEDEEDPLESEETSIEGSSLAVDAPMRDDSDIFLSEVIDSLLRGYQDQLNCENLILEINASRFAWDVGLREVTYNVIKAILMLPLHYLSEIKKSVTNENYRKILKVMIDYFNAIILNYTKTEDAQEDVLKAVEEVAATTPELLAFSQHLLHLLYTKEILSEGKILEWYHQQPGDNDDEVYRERIREVVRPLIEWLDQAEEESSSEEEDDDN